MAYNPSYPFRRETISKSAGLNCLRRLETQLTENFTTLREAATAPVAEGHLIFRITEGPDDALVTHFPRAGLFDTELMELPRDRPRPVA